MILFAAQTIQATQGLDLGLIAAALAFGLRHGIDWDHIAAITDITASQDSPRAGVKLGTLYVLGHSAVVFALGVIAILIGDRLPPSVDAAMGKVVGVTLVGLGVYVIYSLIRHGRDFRMQSQWMLALRGVRATYRWVRARLDSNQPSSVRHEHAHLTAAEYHHEGEDEPAPHLGTGRFRGPAHAHSHYHSDAADPLASYGTKTALGIGALHGIGAETPTQVLIFLTAAGAGGPAAGLVVLAAFLVGLATSNSLITFGSAFGFLAASRRFVVYASLGATTGVISLAIGVLFLLGRETMLPAILGG
ncbi:MAG: hypothetical protein ACR2NT_10390 [Acidimicrobiia bacterium]